MRLSLIQGAARGARYYGAGDCAHPDVKAKPACRPFAGRRPRAEADVHAACPEPDRLGRADHVGGRAAIDPRGLTKTAGPSRFIRSIDAIFPDAPPAHGAVRRDDTESDPDVCTVKPTVMPDHREDAKESVHARP